MKDTKVNEQVIQSLLAAYTIAAAKHGQATWDSDPDAGNEQAAVIEGVYHELRARGRDAQLQLLDLRVTPTPVFDSGLAVMRLSSPPNKESPSLKSCWIMMVLLGLLPRLL